jgi:hypothetical protein
VLDILAGLFIFIVGVIFLWIGLFRIEWFVKSVKESDRGLIDLPAFISDYWFWRIALIGMGILIIYMTLYSFII